MDEVFGAENCLNVIFFQKTTGDTGLFLNHIGDYILWYGKNRASAKYRQLYHQKQIGEEGASQYTFVQEQDGKRRAASREEIANPPASLRFFGHGDIRIRSHQVIFQLRLMAALLDQVADIGKRARPE